MRNQANESRYAWAGASAGYALHTPHNPDSYRRAAVQQRVEIEGAAARLVAMVIGNIT